MIQIILAAVLFAQSTTHPLHLIFETNKGQALPDVHYVLRTSAYQLDFKRAELVFHIGEHSLRIRFNGQLKQVVPSGHARVDKLIRYIDVDQPVDKDQIPKFASVHYDSLYVGINLTCYSRHGGLECDFVALPGADPRQVQVLLEGADEVQIGNNGEVVIQIADQTFRIPKPDAYQLERGQRRSVDIKYELSGKNELSFRIGAYNQSIPLIIDPR